MMEAAKPIHAQMRPPDQVMRLDRLGSLHQTRLSFMRALLRRLHRERWEVSRPVFDIDSHGVGVATYQASGPERAYTLVCFAHDLPIELRSDRVIAEAWDATFALFDGVPTAADIERLGQNVPRQEAGRYLETELVLARANRSARLFDDVVARLANGSQPDTDALDSVGYLMRTTAVYGNGKFGIADRDRIAGRPELTGPFQAEMLTVWLIRTFTVDLVEHLAASAGGNTAVRLDPSLRRRLGIGNATGLGMAPFLVRHPALIHNWMAARETALAGVRALPSASCQEIECFRSALRRFSRHLPRWTTVDAVLGARLVTLASDLSRISDFASDAAFAAQFPWNAICRWSEESVSLESQELVVSLVLEPHPAVVDPLFESMPADEPAHFAIDGHMTCQTLLTDVDHDYAWTLATDFSRDEEHRLFWYVSEEKLEPRLGERAKEAGADLEQPLAVARDVKLLRDALTAFDPTASLAQLLMRHPEHRHTVRRIQIGAQCPFAEIRGNLIGPDFRPIDLLRCKLSFFGATCFDPRSDKWLRITMYQNAPFPLEMPEGYDDGWIWGPEEERC